MKNYRTPRTIGEAQINAFYDPIERLQPKKNNADNIVLIASGIGILAFAVIFAIWG